MNNMGIRPRTVGLSRNQNVPSILSTINGRKVDKSSPQRTSISLKTDSQTHRSGHRSNGDEEPTQVQPSSEDEVPGVFINTRVTQTRGEDEEMSLRKTSSLTDQRKRTGLSPIDAPRIGQ